VTSCLPAPVLTEGTCRPPGSDAPTPRDPVDAAEAEPVESREAPTCAARRRSQKPGASPTPMGGVSVGVPACPRQQSAAQRFLGGIGRQSRLLHRGLKPLRNVVTSDCEPQGSCWFEMAVGGSGG
jgi:hypothetical protein